MRSGRREQTPSRENGVSRATVTSGCQRENDLGIKRTSRGLRKSSGLRVGQATGKTAVVAAVGLGRVQYLVGARGFEPPTPASRTQCATRLRYAPIPG